MTINDCMGRMADNGEVDRDRARYWQDEWQKRANYYRRAGYSDHMAEALAGEDIKVAAKKAAGEIRHVYLARVANMNMQRKIVSAASDEALRKLSVDQMTLMDHKARGLKRRFDGMVANYLKEHHRDLFGRVTKPETQTDFIREMHGERTGNAEAAALAEAVSAALEDMRIMFNEAGGVIGKLDNWGLPHSHNRLAILNAGARRIAEAEGQSLSRIRARSAFDKSLSDRIFQASFDQWFDDIHARLDWTKIENFGTGQPFQTGSTPPPVEIQRSYLREIFDNIAYGDRAADPTYGKTQGAALYRQKARSRYLHFKSADDWLDYNGRYGAGDPHKSLMSHVHQMAKDTVAMRELGPNPELGLDFQGQVIMAEAKKRGMNPERMSGGIQHAQRMLRVERGGAIPSGYWQTMSATFFSNTRKLLNSHLLERAVIASVSDMNSMKMASQYLGAGRTNVITNYLSTVQNMVKEGALTTDEMLRMGWIADAMSDPGVVAARFDAELPASEWAERYSSGIMRISGLSSHTDAGRFAMQKVFSGHLAENMGKSWDAIDPELRAHLQRHRITAADWDQYRNPDWAFKADNGATFLDPLYWRAATDMDGATADDLFLKFQGASEEFIEFGVPTQSLFMRGAVDPAAWGLAPGSPLYELSKSALMFKSFVMSFSANQVNIVARMPDMRSKGAYLAEMLAGATMMGAVALQLTELVKGNDLQEMDNLGFLGRAVLKGGGFAIVGDIVATGEASWGGGLGSYLSGPIPQLVDDTWDLTVSNAIEVGAAAMQGRSPDAKFAKELRKYTGRYLLPKDLPFLGPVVDRMLLDQFQMMLDPENANKVREQTNWNGNGSFWQPGDMLPSRAPSFDVIGSR